MCLCLLSDPLGEGCEHYCPHKRTQFETTTAKKEAKVGYMAHEADCLGCLCGKKMSLSGSDVSV